MSEAVGPEFLTFWLKLVMLEGSRGPSLGLTLSGTAQETVGLCPGATPPEGGPGACL